MAKTVRFSELVKKSGSPHVVTLWTDPKKDRAFVRATRENRILTIKQESVGTKKDFGVVGFREEKNVSYLIFPKPLPKIGEAKVVGIKYDMVTEPTVTDRIKRSKPSRKAFRLKASQLTQIEPETPGNVESTEKHFIATVRRNAFWETTIEVDARNKSEAQRLVEERLKAVKFELDEAIVRNEIREVREQK